MRPVGSKDYYQAKAASVISDSDIDFLTELYLPLIGVMPFAIYVALVSKSKRNPSGYETHAPLLAKLQLTSGQYRKGVEALEAVGLVNTFFKEEGENSYFIYALYAPKDPKHFFEDPLLLGTLRRYIGEEEVEKIHQKYALNPTFEGYQEVSSGFSEYFHPDFSDPIYQGRSLPAMPHKSGSIKTRFDYSIFSKALAELGVEAKFIREKDMLLIEKYAQLYSLDEENAAVILSKCFDLRSYSVDFKSFERQAMATLRFPSSRRNAGKKSQISGDSPIAEKIKLMDETSPIQYLSILQGMKRPAQADISIVNALAFEIGLPSPAINALIDFVLQTNNNVLSSAYCEKLGAYLVREGVETSRDAMDLLLSSKRKVHKGKKKEPTEEEMQENINEEIRDESESTDDVDSFVAGLYGGNQS